MTDNGGFDFDFGEAPAPVEPSSDIRQLTNMLGQVYAGLLEQGFTADQAMTLTNTWLIGLMAGAANHGRE